MRDSGPPLTVCVSEDNQLLVHCPTTIKPPLSRAVLEPSRIGPHLPDSSDIMTNVGRIFRLDGMFPSELLNPNRLLVCGLSDLPANSFLCPPLLAGLLVKELLIDLVYICVHAFVPLLAGLLVKELLIDLVYICVHAFVPLLAGLLVKELLIDLVYICVHAFVPLLAGLLVKELLIDLVYICVHAFVL